MYFLHGTVCIQSEKATKVAHFSPPDNTKPRSTKICICFFKESFYLKENNLPLSSIFRVLMGVQQLFLKPITI